MSLDVYLSQPGARRERKGSGIFVREDGETKEISREEWDLRNPGHEPCVADLGPEETDEVFEANITHNLGKMAGEAGVYQACWRPEELGATKAGQLAPVLREGLAKLKAEPERFREFNPANGWGSYEGLCRFVANYLAACEEYPDASIRVSR